MRNPRKTERVGAPFALSPLAGSDFFERPAAPTKATEDAWKKDLEILAHEHRLLRAAVSAMKSLSAQQQHVIRGAAAHDLYHAGQIRLLHRLYSP